ncbi:MAG: hypothetical protein D3914_09795 [Candidatus Electrothrix sp. LOE2]|nr:hypothetical protein [Candidatus Electrothrix sp. LOE2]
MIISKPTRYGAGITLYGDYQDLCELHETIHYLSESGALTTHLSDFVLGLAYDIRHAYQKDRKEKFFGHDEYDRVKYRGVDILWPIILIQVGLLRWSAGFMPTNKCHQSNLYRIEYCLEESLNLYDSDVGDYCMDWLSRFSGFPTNYIVSFISYCTKNYIYEGKAGKSRFKKLPSLLTSLSSLSNEYREYDEAMQDIANEKKCSPHELKDWSDWKEFRW